MSCAYCHQNLEPSNISCFLTDLDPELNIFVNKLLGLQSKNAALCYNCMQKLLCHFGNGNSKSTPKVTKYCIACKNKSTMLEKKNFFQVPSQTKSQWCKAAGLKNVPLRPLHICEDHLNLKDDLENYRYWTTMGGYAKLKPQAFSTLSRENNTAVENLNPENHITTNSEDSKHLKTSKSKKVMASTNLVDLHDL